METIVMTVMTMINRLIFTALCLSLISCGTLQKVQTGAIEKVKTVKDVAREKVGATTKHDLLLERIEAVTMVQEETKQHLQAAYDELAMLTGDASNVTAQLEEIEDTYENSEDVVNNFKKRVEAVDNIAKALFQEWRSELRQYKNKNLRKKSAENLAKTKKQYTALYKSMQKSYKEIQPLMSVLHDNSLYLKHNRSEEAISGFQAEVTVVKDQMQTLIDDIEASIEESSAFVEVSNVH